MNRAVKSLLHTIAALIAIDAGAQDAASGTQQAARPSATAVRAERAPEIDGSDADAVWRNAPEITGFQVFDPGEGGKPLHPTSARVAYDDHNLYVFTRMFDPEPHKIERILGRRDVRVAGDHIKLLIDSYRDRRSGYQFAVNPAGVKRDYTISDDVNEDDSWDGVWHVATRIDSLGWTAEFRIPLSQLRFPRADEHTFGFAIARDIGSTGERSSWPLYRRSVRGISSQFGDLVGLRGLASPRQVEAAPYVVARNESRLTPGDWERRQAMNVGADLKIGLLSNLTLNVAVNPDFGQVEADPAVLNLTAFETSFEERRPFFLEATDIFNFSNWTQLFYSRRIGRAPQLSGLVSDPYAQVPGNSTIAGAAKLTGRFANGIALGGLVAHTLEENVGDIAVEPATTYGVLRLQRDMRGGASGIGLMATGMHRSLDDVSSRLLREDAFTSGVNARHRFMDRKYEISGSLAASTVRGSPQAIARTQRSSVHYYHRPDGGLDYDTTRTSLSGISANANMQKVTGVWRFGARYLYTSPGFEVNDVGFLNRADWHWGMVEGSYRSRQPNKVWRSASGFLQQWVEGNAAGVPNANSIESGWQMELHNRLRVSVNSWAQNLFPAFCDRCSRGGPALRLSPFANVLVNLSGDARKTVIPSFAAIYTTGDEGRTMLWRVRPYVTVRQASNLSWELGTRYQLNRDNTQWVTNRGVIGSDTTHYVFGHLDQHLLSFTARLNYTPRPTLTFQFYGEPFVTTGEYSNLRELSATPRAESYDERFRATTVSSVAGFNVKQFRSNAVIRWEYQPGSTLYLVWQQARDESWRDLGTFDAERDYRNLFRARPDNTLLMKVSYWMNW
jgi:hypothetical protein